MFNTFELGQAVVYQPERQRGDRRADDGATYYVAASTNQTNLQGNTRFTDAQVIGLAETENEARAGVLIDIGARSAGATATRFDGQARARLRLRHRRRHHRQARRRRTRRARAPDWTTSEDNANLWAKFKEVVGTNVPDMIFTKLTQVVSASTAGGPGVGATGSLSVAGALAFTFVDHDVVTTSAPRPS